MADAGIHHVAEKLDALCLELRPRLGDVIDVQRRMGARLGLELHPVSRWLPDAETGLTYPELKARALVRPQAQCLDVEGARALGVLGGDGDEVELLKQAQPTEPSIWSWISRFISTAYSSGSSFVIGSTKPETIIALASVSEIPRLIR